MLARVLWILKNLSNAKRTPGNLLFSHEMNAVVYDYELMKSTSMIAINTEMMSINNKEAVQRGNNQ